MFSIDVRPLVRPRLKVCEMQEHLGHAPSAAMDSSSAAMDSSSAAMDSPSVCASRTDFLKQLLSATSFVFAPGLLDVLQSSTLPAITFFKSLPTDHKKVWGVYLLVLEKRDPRSKIYIGSGTSVTGGVSSRLCQYDKQQLLLRDVKNHGSRRQVPPSAHDAASLEMSQHVCCKL